MAKKTAPKKKAAVKKAKAVKLSKPVKTAKKAAPAPKLAKEKKTAAAVKSKILAPKAAKPALMTKKGKVAKEAEEGSEREAAVKKPQTIVSMLETPTSEENIKVEKVSKAKPIKIERGNLSDEKAKWAELNKKYGKEKALNYKMTETYPSLMPLQHKVLGWGYILTNENDRLEVLFENGIRMLISNYKT